MWLFNLTEKIYILKHDFKFLLSPQSRIKYYKYLIALDHNNNKTRDAELVLTRSGSISFESVITNAVNPRHFTKLGINIMLKVSL